MGALIQPPGSGNGRRRRGAYRPMAEINVTPFVDVMLVLLIVFMVTAPLLTVGVPVDLPQTRAQSIPNQDEKPLIVSVRSDGQIFVLESQVELENMAALLMAVSEQNPEARIFVRGDRNINYGRRMEIGRAAGRERVCQYG